MLEIIHQIRKLKLQPSHGQSQPPSFDFDDLINSFKNLGDGARAVVEEQAFQKLADIVQKVTDQVTILEQRNRSLQTSLRINISSAASLGQRIDELSDQYGISSKLLRDYVGNLNSVAKGNAKYLTGLKDAGKEGKAFNKVILEQYNRNQLLLGLTDEQSNAYTRFLAVQGETAEETKNYNDELAAVASQIKDATGQTDAYANILTQIADAGPTIQTAYAGAAEELARAAIKANRLGVTFKDLVSISDKFLDIESSISNELELQLLGGKKINSEKFRQAAVNRDLEGMADELTNIMKEQGDISELSIFAQRKLADTLGMDTDQLFKMYQTMQANERITGKDIEEFQGEVNNLDPNAAGTVTTAEEAAQAASILGTKEKQQLAADLAYTRSIVKSFPDQVTTIGDLSTELINMQEISLGLSEKFTSLLDRAAANDGVLALLGIGVGASSINDLIQDITTANLNVNQASIEAKTITINGLDSTSAGDAFFPSNGGNVILSPTEGAIFPSPNDEIVVAPNAGALAAAGSSTNTSNPPANYNPSFNVIIQGAGLDELIKNIDIRKGERMNA